jgi:hypothetical protein
MKNIYYIDNEVIETEGNLIVEHTIEIEIDSYSKFLAYCIAFGYQIKNVDGPNVRCEKYIEVQGISDCAFIVLEYSQKDNTLTKIIT